MDVPAKLAARARLFDTETAARPTRPTRTRWPWSRCGPGVSRRCASTTSWSRCGCWLTGATSSAAPAPRRSTGCTGCCSSSVPGGAKRFLSAAQAQALLDSVAPTDVAGRVRHQLATELLGEIVVLDKKMKDSDKTPNKAVTATGTGLLDLFGIGPAGVVRILGDVADVARFATRARFASWNGTAPLDASSGEQKRHRLSRAGNRRINRALHIMAIVQIRHNTPGRADFRRRVAAGKTPMEAMRALKRRLSDVVYRQLVADASKASPGGHLGATTTSSAANPTPMVGSSDQSLPGLGTEPTPPDHDSPYAGPGTRDSTEPAPAARPRRRTRDAQTQRTTGQTRRRRATETVT